MFGSRFIDNVSTDSEKVCSFENCDSRIHFLFCNPSDTFAHRPGKCGSYIWAYRSLSITQLILIFSETTSASSSKMQHDIALSSLYISTGNNVTIFFRSAENRINMLIFGHVRDAISRWGFNRFRKSSVFETAIQGLHFLLCKLLDIFAPWPQKLGLNWTYRRLRVT